MYEYFLTNHHVHYIGFLNVIFNSNLGFFDTFPDAINAQT